MTTLRVDKNNVDKITKELREKGEVIPVIADSIFKSIFRNEEMKGILSFLISEITGLNEDYIYDNLEYRDSYIRKQNITLKESISDLIVDIDDNVISLDMNVQNTIYNRFRNTD